MNLRKLKQYRALGLAALLIASMIAGTAAYLTQSQTAVNEFRTGKYSTKLVEKFTSPKDWQPGIETNKDVKVRNEGTVPVFASITLHQSWVRRANVYDADGKIVLPKKGDAFGNTFAGPDGEEYAALMLWGADVVLLSSDEPQSVRLGLPVVSSVKQAAGKWLLLSETPDDNGNLTFYYMGVLKGGKTTPLLLDGVKMNPEIQASTIFQSTKWDKAAQKWITTRIENPTWDYQNARFTLRVTMYTVQATSAAMKEMFDSDTTSAQGVISYLESIAITGSDTDTSRDDTAAKKLYLDKKDGKLTYTPATPGGNWFMSHLNMLPGESYRDTLVIENQTSKTHKLYLQAIPKNGQKTLAKELLELIHMTVYYEGKPIYVGTALGKEYPGSIQNLQNVVELGRFVKDAATTIDVELTLDKDTPLKYADMLTQIDWKFVTEEQPDNADSPKTGDTGVMRYIAFMLISGVTVIILLISDHRRRKVSH